MNLNEMLDQCYNDSVEWFPNTAGNVVHQALCIGGEAGELLNELKKVWREGYNLDNPIPCEDTRQRLAEATEETIDVFIYLCNYWATLGYTGNDVMKMYEEKRAFNKERFEK